MRRKAELESLADLVERHLDMTAIDRLLATGPPDSPPFIPPGVGE